MEQGLLCDAQALFSGGTPIFVWDVAVPSFSHFPQVFPGKLQDITSVMSRPIPSDFQFVVRYSPYYTKLYSQREQTES